jgi:ElaB/YqjD/DUF883 family membrane-anchored ribosome-binding protein
MIDHRHRASPTRSVRFMKSSSHKASHVQQDADELISNISKLMADAEEMLNESTSHHAEEKVALIQAHRNGHDQHGFMEKYVSAKSKISAAMKRTDETIRACPYESLAIALGVGVVIGAALARRRD